MDDDQGLAVEFARELRCLREQAGRPTYRELSSRAHFSTSTLAEATSGRKLPSLDVTVAFVRACDGDVGEWEARWREYAAELAVPGEESAAAPYVGLAAFRRGDADRFFGRDRLVGEVVARVRERRMVAVFGPSGSGKSSVLMAGLLPALVPDEATDRAAVLTPGAHPLEECAARLAPLVGASTARLKAEFAEDPRGLHLCIGQAVANRPDHQDFVLVVDQFEELFTVCEDPAERAAFVAALTTAATEPTGRTRVVLGVRADFYGHCGEYPELVDALRDGQVLVGVMTSDELRLAITGPAEAVGCRVETALVSRLVADATGRPGALPLVSHALRETWRRRRGTVLSLGAYEAAGGIRHALARTAEAVYANLDEVCQQVAHQLFLRLTALGEGADDTKRRVRRDELDESAATVEVLERLASARLITVDGDGIEITHEALIRHWPRLRGWLDDDRDGLRVHRQLTEATNVWEAHDRERGSLLRGVRLSQAENLAGPKGSALTDREREFLAASLTARSHEQSTARRRIRRTRQLVALLAVLLLVASVSLVSAVRAQNAATEQRNAAVVGRVLSDANSLRDTNPALSVQLTLAAYRVDPSQRARDALLGSLDTPYASRIESDDFFGDAVLSADGKLLALPGSPRTRLWDVSNPHRPRRLPDVLPSSEMAAFGPDRMLLLKSSPYEGERANEVWDVHEPRRPRQLASFRPDEPLLDTQGGMSVDYSRNGRAAATTDTDGSARLWDLTDLGHPRPRVLLGTVRSRSAAGATSVVFSPRGDRLAVVDAADSLHLWEVSNARPGRHVVLPGRIAAFTPDGRTLAVADQRGSVQLWDLSSPGAPRRLTSFTNRDDVSSLAFSPGTGLLAVGDSSGSVGLWNVSDPRRPAPLIDLAGHTGWPSSTAFGPHGDTLVTMDEASVRIWDLGPVLVSHPDSVSALRLNHRGDLLVTGARDQTVRLWHVDGQRARLLATFGKPYAFGSLSFSPDDRTLLVDSDGSVQVWDITTPTRPVHAANLPEAYGCGAIAFNPTDSTVVLCQEDSTTVYDLADPYHPKVVDELAPFAMHGLAFHPNGDIVQVSHHDRAELWNLDASATSRKLATLSTPSPSIGTIGPDGSTLAISRGDTRQTQLWSIGDPRKPALLATMRPRVHGSNRWVPLVPPSVYSPDGHLLATIDGERSVGLWDISDPREPASVTTFTFGHQVQSLSMTPDGSQLFAAANENVVQRRYVHAEDVAKRICAVANPRITAAEWQDHFRQLPYQPPCR